MILKAMKNIRLDERWIILIYFILKPLYFFDSGLPQIGDMFLVLSVLYLLLRDHGMVTLPKKSIMWVLTFATVVVYQIIIDIIWAGVTGETKMLINAAHYVFNFLAAVLCIIIGQKIGVRDLVKTIAKGCFFCAIVIGIGLVLNGNKSIRSTGFFNNPNQLGYFSLILLSCVLLFENEFTLSEKAVTIILALIGSVVSLSKSAILGIGGLAVLYSVFGRSENNTKKLIFQISLIIILCIFTYLLFFSDSSIILNNRLLLTLRKRILNIRNENDSTLGSGRGYSRVFEMGIHFLWGMGEGAYSRFISLPGKEVHSTYVNIFVSYGLLGMLAYLWIFLKPLMDGKNTKRNLACFSGIYLYFIAHNGVRNTLVWFIIATVLQISIQHEGQSAVEAVYL